MGCSHLDPTNHHGHNAHHHHQTASASDHSTEPKGAAEVISNESACRTSIVSDTSSAVSEDALALIHSLLGDDKSSIFSALATVLASDPSLPSLHDIANAEADAIRKGNEATGEVEARTCLLGSSALKPSPALNTALTRLVRILLAPRPPQVHAAAVRILDDRRASWRARAAAVRVVAAAAERELELASAEASVAAVEASASDIPPSVASIEPADLSKHSISLHVALSEFPYLDNYELLVDAEAHVLRGPPPPPAPSVFQSSAARSALKVKPLGTNSAWWGSSAHSPTMSNNLSTPLTSSELENADDRSPLEGMTVAFCGSGPMPLTGVMLNVRAGARVVLVDIDEAAVIASRRLIQALGNVGLLNPGMFQIIHADATDVQFLDARICKHDDPLGEETAGKENYSSIGLSESAARSSSPVVHCHAIILASLLPEEVKNAVAKQLAASGHKAPELLLVRSAVGLVARLAYHRVGSNYIRNYLAYCGEWVPRRSVGGVYRDAGEYSLDSESGNLMLGTIDADILNSVEVYRRYP